jgi:adenylate kinase
MNIIIMGVQGAGKGTQAKRISEVYSLKHVSSGDVYREEKDTIDAVLKAHVDAGNLLPDSWIVEQIKKHLVPQGNIIDGVPRTYEQAVALDGLISVDKVVYLQLSDDVALERMLARRLCKSCHTIYGLNNPAPVLCCDQKPFQRVDDNRDAIEKRLQIYHEQTKPLLEFYRKKGVLCEINADQGVANVFSDIQRVLDTIN